MKFKVKASTQIHELDTLEKIRAAWDYAICRNHTGKMENLWSISTCCLNNKLCLQRLKAGHGVCAHCFSARQQERQPNTRDKLEFNTRFLTACEWPIESIPVVPVQLFRFESFGDLNPVEHGGIFQVKNYFNFAAKNPNTRFALWTKNPWVIDAAIKAGAKKPDNLQIVFSVAELNSASAACDAIRALYPFIDRTFAVYEKAYADAHGVKINCGARDCFGCRNCYVKDGPEIIRELLK